MTTATMLPARNTLLQLVLPAAAQAMIADGAHPSLVLALFNGSITGIGVRSILFEAFVAAHGQVSREAAIAKADRIMAVFAAHGEDRESLVRHVGYSPHKLGPIPDQIATRVSGMTAAEVHEVEWSYTKSFHPAYYMMGILFALGTWWVCETLQAQNPGTRRADLARLPESFKGAEIAADILAEVLAVCAD